MQPVAWHSTVQEPWAMADYQRQRAEGKSHTVAIRARAKVWLRISYAIWRDRTPDVSATFEAAQQQKLHKAAEAHTPWACRSDGAAQAVPTPSSGDQQAA